MCSRNVTITTNTTNNNNNNITITIIIVIINAINKMVKFLRKCCNSQTRTEASPMPGHKQAIYATNIHIYTQAGFSQIGQKKLQGLLQCFQ